MKIAKVSYNNEVFYAELKGDALFRIDGCIYSEPFSSGGPAIPLEQAKFLAPAEPTKIVCVGKNYVDHVSEMAKQGFGDAATNTMLPERPELFLKPPSALNDPFGEIEYPDGANRVDYEGEIAVIIKKGGRYIKQEEVMEHILGLTLLNDTSRRDRPKSETQWTCGKSYDTFCPVGPYITTVDSLQGITIRTDHNGERKQSSDTEHMIFKIPELIAYITNCMTLMPGDIIATGTPSGVGPIQIGDTVTISSDQLGTLTNTYVKEKRP